MSIPMYRERLNKIQDQSSQRKREMCSLIP